MNKAEQPFLDTIYAPATPPGRSGVAVVRVSGPQALESLKILNCNKMPHPRYAELYTLNNPVSRETIDKALVLYFQNPASYTGEDVVEYHIHGGRAVLQGLLKALSICEGHRLAEAGEFTRRAFENGKMDLTQAEAVADLIDAETQAQKSQALLQMGGALYDLYAEWTETLKKSLAHLEADIEFPDEDMPEGVSPQVLQDLNQLKNEIDGHLNDNRSGERLRDGLKIAVIGAPNAGKSSLVNALAQRDVAIVSDIAGTTRDLIEVHMDLNGLHVTLIDTAGLRPDQLGDSDHDSIESEGIRRALKQAHEADVKMLVFDATEATLDKHTQSLIDENALIVVNKEDLASAKHPDPDIDRAVYVSAKSGKGLKALEDALLNKAQDMIAGAQDRPTLTRARHRDALELCRSALERGLNASLPELVAEDTRIAMRALGKITGRVDVEDLLDVIFSDFCIGK